jgi:hypothetical protein
MVGAQALNCAVVGKLPVAPGVLTAELQGSKQNRSSTALYISKAGR